MGGWIVCGRCVRSRLGRFGKLKVVEHQTESSRSLCRDNEETRIRNVGRPLFKTLPPLSNRISSWPKAWVSFLV